MSTNPAAPLSSRPAWTVQFRREIQYALDILILGLAFFLAYLLRFLEFPLPAEWLPKALTQLPYVVLIQLAVLVLNGIYSFIWRYIGLREIHVFGRAVLLAAIPVLAIRLADLPTPLEAFQVPLSVLCMDTILAFGGLLGIRVLRRVVYEHHKSRSHDDEQLASKPVLLIGAGQTGVMAAKELQGRSSRELKIRGFVDDDKSKVGKVIQGIRVLGTTEDLPRLVEQLAIDHVVLTIVEASGQEIRRILDICESIPVRARTVPGLGELLEGKVQISSIRDIAIEDLLGREPVQLDEQALHGFLHGKRVMVTGAGGSIGSELVRQLARFAPQSLMLVERSEFALFTIDRKVREAHPQLTLEPLLADISDERRMRQVIAEHQPQVLFHAAAHKHVPMMERNAGEAVKNNVLATRQIGRLAGELGVENFVLISTDKAVRPASIMGATKRLAELVIQELDRSYDTCYLAVRFGNVLGSAGSVVEIFEEQIAQGGPVKVTHQDMVRYFMTIPEAAQLVIQAATMGQGGEIFVLDMGEPVRIVDLARSMIKLADNRHGGEIEIVFTGPRPGEKLREELDQSQEKLDRTRHPKIFIGKLNPYSAGLDEALSDLEALAELGTESSHAIRARLEELIPEAKMSDVALGT